MLNQFKVRAPEQMRDPRPAPGMKTVDAEHVMACHNEAPAQVTAKKPGSTGDHYPFGGKAVQIITLVSPVGPGP